MVRATVEKPASASAGQRSIAVLDAGNRTIKYAQLNGGVVVLPASVKELELWDDFEWRPEYAQHTVFTQVGDRRFLMGKVAHDLGGKGLFEDSKADLLWLTAIAAMEPVNGIFSVDEMRVLCPDSRNNATQEAAAHLQSLQWLVDAQDGVIYRNGDRVQVQRIDRVKLVDEGLPAFRYAQMHALWTHPDAINAIVDIGGGETTGNGFTSDGVIVRGMSWAVRGANDLAGRVALALQKELTLTPDLSAIMDAIAIGDYSIRVGLQTVNFEAQYRRAFQGWQDMIHTAIRTKWLQNAQFNTKLAEILLVGGSAPLLENGVQKTNGRIRVLADPAIPSLHQTVNVLGMLG